MTMLPVTFNKYQVQNQILNLEWSNNVHVYGRGNLLEQIFLELVGGEGKVLFIFKNGKRYI